MGLHAKTNNWYTTTSQKWTPINAKTRPVKHMVPTHLYTTEFETQDSINILFIRYIQLNSVTGFKKEKKRRIHINRHFFGSLGSWAEVLWWFRYPNEMVIREHYGIHAQSLPRAFFPVVYMRVWQIMRMCMFVHKVLLRGGLCYGLSEVQWSAIIVICNRQNFVHLFLQLLVQKARSYCEAILKTEHLKSLSLKKFHCIELSIVLLSATRGSPSP